MPKKSIRKHKQKTFDLKILLCVLALLLISVVVYNKYYFVQKLNLTVTGAEPIEKTQKFVPLDVQKEFEKQKKLYELTNFPTLRIPILMYHYIEYVKDPTDKTRISLNTPPQVFEEQVKTLKNAGFTFLTVGDLTSALKGNRTLPENPIVLTFDDGYKDFYTDAYPILKKYNAAATQYVISGYMSHPLHLSASEVRKISDEGLVEIGAHTVTHDWLKNDSLKHVREEVMESKKTLEKVTGKEIVSFAYPYGAFDQQTIKVVSSAGFKTSVSTIPGINQSFFNRYFLYRLRPGRRTGQELINWLGQSKFNPF